MRLLTFTRKNQSRIGLAGPEGQIIDIAEIHRRYLRGGSPVFLNNMQAFIEGGVKALSAAKKAARYVGGKDLEGQKKLNRAGALLRPNQIKFLSPITWPVYIS